MKKTIGYSKTGKVHIGDNVFVGWGSIILPNTIIGNRVVVGAGTVVAKNIPDNSVVVGNPCHIICTYDEYVEKTRGLMERFPVIDLLPDEIIKDENSKQKPEDEQKNAEAKLQKVHDKYIAKIEELLAEKDKEIMTV